MPRPLGQRVVLVVGEEGGDLPFEVTGAPPFTFVEIDEVGAELLDSLRPDVVLSPLMTHSFDCIDLARILCSLKYAGAYRVLSPILPSPELIRREIRALCPGLSFDLIFVGQTGPIR